MWNRSRTHGLGAKTTVESIGNGLSLSAAKLLDTRLEKLEKSITDLSVSVDTLKTEFGGLKISVNMVEAKQKRLESRLVKVERTLAENSSEFDERVREAIGVIQRKEKDISLRFNLKHYVFVYRCLHELAGPLLQNLFSRRSFMSHTAARTRSQTFNMLQLPSAKSRYGYNSVSFLAADRWNSLPQVCREASSLPEFATLTKSHLGYPL